MSENDESKSKYKIYYKCYVNKQFCSVFILCYDYSTVLLQPLVTVTILLPLKTITPT